MSGAEAFALACGVIQVISFAHETITLCKKVYRSEPPDTRLYSYAASLADLSDKVRARNEVLESSAIPHSDLEALCVIAAGCATAARQLQERVRYIAENQRSGRLGVAIQHAKSRWRQDRLTQREKDLLNYQQALQTHLLAKLW